MTDYFITITNKRRPLKLMIKRNNKKIYNPTVLKELKKNKTNINLPTNFTYNKTTNKIIKIFNNKRYTKEYKELTIKEKRKLKYYGKNIYDRIEDKVVNKDLIYKKTSFQGSLILRKKYEDKVIKNNQIYKKKLVAPKKITVSVLFTAGTVKKLIIKDAQGKYQSTKEYETYEETEFKTYDIFTDRTDKKFITEKIEQDRIKYKNELLSQSGIIAIYNNLKMSFNDFRSKYEVIYGEFNLNNAPINDLVNKGDISYNTIQAPTEALEFDLNHFIMRMDGAEEHDWDTKTNRCVYDYIIHKYGKAKGLIKQVNYLNLYNIFNNTNLEELDILTEEEFNKYKEDYKNSNGHHAFIFSRQNGCFGNIWQHEDCTEYDEDMKHQEFKDYEDYSRRYWGVSPKKLDRFTKKFNIPHYALDSNKNKIHYSYPENNSNTYKSLCYIASNGHLNPIEDNGEIKSIARRFSNKKFTNKKKEDNVEGAEELPQHIIEANDRFKFLCDTMIESNTQIINNNVKMNKGKISSFKINKTEYIFNDRLKELGKEYKDLVGEQYKGETLPSICSKFVKKTIKTAQSNTNNLVYNLLKGGR